MIVKTYDKKCNAGRLTSEIVSAGFLQYPTTGYKLMGVSVYQIDEEWETRIELTDSVTSEEQTIIDGIVSSSIDVPLPESEAPTDDESRPFVRAESKPTYMTTYFTTRGDTESEIGGGTELSFNFNNEDDELENAPSGFRQKMIVCSFIDTVRLKEGAIYWENMPFGSYIDLCLGVPNGGYYLTNTGELRQNTTGESLRVARFVKSSPMMGSCPMGDELNTETASFDIPPGTLFGFTVTVPSSVGFSDNCHGAVQLELYRERTVILPDE